MSNYQDELWELEGLLREFFSTAEGKAVISGAAILLIVFAVIMLALAVVMYVFQSLSLYKIAKRRGLRLYGFAWVPVLNMYTIGSIADDYDMKVNGIVRGRRKLMLGLSIGTFVASWVLNAMSNAFTRQYIWRGVGNGNIIAATCLLLVVSMVVIAISITCSVFTYISLYKVYKSCSPASCVVFTVLGIIFSVTQPFFLFADRNKDFGMPANPALSSGDEPRIVRHNERDYGGR